MIPPGKYRFEIYKSTACVSDTRTATHAFYNLQDEFSNCFCDYQNYCYTSFQKKTKPEILSEHSEKDAMLR